MKNLSICLCIAAMAISGCGTTSVGQRVRIALAAASEVEVTDETGSTIVTNLDPARGLIVFINDVPVLHAAKISIDGEKIGVFNPGERRIHNLKPLRDENGNELGMFGEHRVQVQIFAVVRGRATLVADMEDSFCVSDLQRQSNIPGFYWVLEIRPDSISIPWSWWR